MFDIYILNLRAEEKRRYMCEGALFAMQTPFDRLKHWSAIDDLNYQKTRDVLEDAIADGFPAFQSYLDKGQQNEYNITVYTQMWNYCRFWRYLVELGETAMIIQDDRRICTPYPALQKIVQDLREFDPKFQFLSLWCKHFAMNAADFPIRWISEGSPIAYGIFEGGADTGHIVTPKGAEWLIDNVIGFFPPRVEYAVRALCHKNAHFYTLADEDVNLDHLVPDNRAYLPGRILNSKSSDGLVRSIHTTSDDHTLAK